MNICVSVRAGYWSSLLLITFSGCGGNNRGTDPPAPPSGAELSALHCSSCHDPGDHSYSGRTVSIVDGKAIFPRNLTPDQNSGIGAWTDPLIEGAIRTGVDDQGHSLCSTMPRFSELAESEVTSIVQFLRALPPVAKAIPDSTCP